MWIPYATSYYAFIVVYKPSDGAYQLDVTVAILITTIICGLLVLKYHMKDMEALEIV